MRSLRNLVLATATITAMSAAGAQAAVVLSDSFDDASGATTLNYAGFSNFDVSNGTVDIIGMTNTYGLSGVGGYVDLDGSSKNGGVLTTKASYDFNTGDVVTLSFDVSGNQRVGVDNFFGGFTFSGLTLINNFTQGGGFGDSNLGSINSDTAQASGSVGKAAPYETYLLRFTAASAGSLKAFIGTSSADNVGPLIDNFKLDIASAIPEPATWAMMIIGFGGVGSALRSARRRRLSPAFA
jgi:hypothetical protein